MERISPDEIVKTEVARQADFGMEPSREDFVIAGIEEVKAQLDSCEREFKELREWYDRLLENFKRLKVERVAYMEKVKEIFEEIERVVGLDIKWAGEWKDYQALKQKVLKEKSNE